MYGLVYGSKKGVSNEDRVRMMDTIKRQMEDIQEMIEVQEGELVRYKKLNEI